MCHALSGDAHAAGYSSAPAAVGTRDGFRADERDAGKGAALGWWDGMIGPGKAFDTDRFFVVSTNLLGGCRGTTGPSSPNPATGRPYGAGFPVITVADMVRAERALLHELGITRIKLLTNNPQKISSLRDHGIEVAGRLPLVTNSNTHNERYLRAKTERAGHLAEEWGRSLAGES